MSGMQRTIERLLAEADVELNGNRLWDPHIRDSRFYARVMAHGSLGLGDSFVDGWWDVVALDEMIARLLNAGIDRRIHGLWPRLAQSVVARLMNPQSPARAGMSVQRHYDLGNGLYEIMLDSRLVYSCGYWRNARSLDDAQEAKLDLVCRKIDLKRGHTVLDIGCGWGSWARFAAERYGARVVGITLSPAQLELGRTLCRGLPVTLLLQDYRAISGRFDRIVSIGMFEHVGARNFRRYMKIVHDHLEEDGLFLLHTIGGGETCLTTDPWIHRHVFPNSLIPSARQIAESLEGHFVIEDWENFGADYDRTLMEWWGNFERGRHLLNGICDERFRRRWKYYLQSSAGTFRARRNHVWQLVLSPQGVPGGYHAGSYREKEHAAPADLNCSNA